MIYRISIILYQYKYCIEKTDQYPALQGTEASWSEHKPVFLVSDTR